MQVVLKYKIEQAQQRLKCGDKWVNFDRLFTNWCGEPIDPNTPYSWLSRFCKRTGMRRAKFAIHSFRHLNASLLITSGVDVKTVSAELGHSQVSTTLNIYAHTFEQTQAAASKAIAEKLPLKKAAVNPKMGYVQKKKSRNPALMRVPGCLLWCARWDLNPYDIRHTPLKRACLPIPALAQKIVPHDLSAGTTGLLYHRSRAFVNRKSTFFASFLFGLMIRSGCGRRIETFGSGGPICALVLRRWAARGENTYIEMPGESGGKAWRTYESNRLEKQIDFP